jgi:hypothetical protein
MNKMFNELLENNFNINVDIINTTNKILIDRVPKEIAITYFLQNKENTKDVDLILNTISAKEKTDFDKLSIRKKKSFIIKLNKIILYQMQNLF